MEIRREYCKLKKIKEQITFVDYIIIYTNALSVSLLHHHLNGLGNENLCSVQEVMRASKQATDKYKNVCEDFPNLGILTKSSTPGEIQLTFGHAAVGSKSPGEPAVAFALAGDLSSPYVISFNIEIAFATNSDPSPDRGVPSSRRRRQPRAIKETALLIS